MRALRPLATTARIALIALSCLSASGVLLLIGGCADEASNRCNPTTGSSSSGGATDAGADAASKPNPCAPGNSSVAGGHGW